MNNKQAEEKRAAIIHMRSIMELYDIHNTREVRHRLADDYNTVLSDSTIKRYRKIILAEDRLIAKTKRLEQKKISKEKKTVAKKIKNDEYPFYVKCPGKMKDGSDCPDNHRKITARNHGTICSIHGYEFDPKIGYWIDMSTGIKVGWKSKRVLGGTAPLTHEND